ncbi:DUF6191 domain-containing protein [Streptomyces sp. NPDC005474]|uniref:DUF6191 domain-containing protein n=1 Tax=Streptomyces sp. NPDC005474 TaxID=3154878 RepID=UPI0034536542
MNRGRRADSGRRAQSGRAGPGGPALWLPISGAWNSLHATFSPGKESELKERQSALIMRDDEEDGAPPHRTTVDLEGGVAVIRMPRSVRSVGAEL